MMDFGVDDDVVLVALAVVGIEAEEYTIERNVVVGLVEVDSVVADTIADGVAAAGEAHGLHTRDQEGVVAGTDIDSMP